MKLINIQLMTIIIQIYKSETIISYVIFLRQKRTENYHS